MGKIIELKLKILAKLILKKYQPKIIGITGSIGKTSTKEAVYAVLKNKYRVRRSIKNYNNELGLPLTIIGEKAHGRNIFAWTLVFLRAFRLIIFTDKNYPELLVLEMGVDRPGDMDYLLDIVKCDVGVLTYIGTVHVEYFKNHGELIKEKMKLIDSLSENASAVINYDNKNTQEGLSEIKTQKISYGLDEGADLRASKIRNHYISEKNSRNLTGISFILEFKNKEFLVKLPDVLGAPALYSALGAAGVGLALGLSLKEISAGLKEYKSPKGRMRVVEGIKNTVIIDDTYNAEPESMRTALNTFKNIPSAEGARKFAVLGDILELGDQSVELHQNIGKIVHKAGIDKLIVVGERARDIARSAEEAGMKVDNIFCFPFSAEAGLFLQDRIRENDMLLVKGSQGARMEKIVKELMAEPLRAEELLVRHSREWIKK
ncbi:MAG: UDP-N-acetylmuramoyl-tripeptide--D-alanyl-D-alanine ligase [Patescibacteria group bacterium]|nr:UDP-N-acetylmuramoyl-tripeptide--D-alanyl-D-alanine ligase [Patescibacteria group bacterium]